eukprot:COSAG04_NODE_1159_length_8037_cov_3.743890_1_plen_516_part_00
MNNAQPQPEPAEEEPQPELKDELTPAPPSAQPDKNLLQVCCMRQPDSEPKRTKRSPSNKSWAPEGSHQPEPEPEPEPAPPSKNLLQICCRMQPDSEPKPASRNRRRQRSAADGSASPNNKSKDPQPEPEPKPVSPASPRPAAEPLWKQVELIADALGFAGEAGLDLPVQKVRRAEQKLSLPSTGTLIERVGRIQRTLAARSTTPTPRAKAEVRRASPARAARGPPIWKQVEDIGGVLGLEQGGDAARVVAQAEGRLSLPCTGALVQRLARIQQHEAYVQLARPKQQPSPRQSLTLVPASPDTSPAARHESAEPLWKRMQLITDALGLDPEATNPQKVSKAEEMLSLPSTGRLIERVARVQSGLAALVASQGDVQAMERLIAEGVSADAKDEEGRPALVIAAGEGHLDVLKLLHRHGANLEATNTSGGTALMFAAIYGKADCAEALLEWGADKDAADTGGLTALHKAAYFGHLECARLLVRARADRAKRDKWGKTALELARKEGHAEVAALLEQAQ